MASKAARAEAQERERQKSRGQIYKEVAYVDEDGFPTDAIGPVFDRVYDDGEVVTVDFDNPRYSKAWYSSSEITPPPQSRSARTPWAALRRESRGS